MKSNNQRFLRYFFHIAYQGTKYCGWQRHPDGLSVQEIMETALSQLLKTAVNIIGCGRTDAHVHASQFFFHVDLEKQWDFDLFFRLNKILPDDIAVLDIIPMQGLPHARFDAMQRSYDYFIHTYKDPFLNSSSSLYLGQFRYLDRIKAAVALLPLYNDYRGFCKSPDRNENTTCHISSAGIFANSNGDRLRFHISANRFLGRMVRIIAGRLIEIGQGKMSVDEFESYLIGKTTPKVIIPAYPHGLFLSKVTYPYLDIPTTSAFSSIHHYTLNSDWQAV